jgi:hypothetical protein
MVAFAAASFSDVFSAEEVVLKVVLLEAGRSLTTTTTNARISIV